MHRLICSLFLLALLGASGCGTAGAPGQRQGTPALAARAPVAAQPPSPAPSPSPVAAPATAAPSPQPPDPPGVTVRPPFDQALEQTVRQAREDLARSRRIAPDAIEVVEVRQVAWPNRGLGCPTPGMEYPEVPVDGLLIRLKADGQTFEYHSGGNRAPIMCEPSSGTGAPGNADR